MTFINALHLINSFAMGNIDTRVDSYISKAAPFAKPVLIHLRKLVHQACPQVQETIKWGMPFFEYKGLLCNMASFKQHCSFGFWKAALMKDSMELKEGNKSGMGHLGKITGLADLPPAKKITSWIKEAAKLNDDDVKLPTRKKSSAENDL